MKFWILSWLSVSLLVSCLQNVSAPDSNEMGLVKDSVNVLAANIAKELSLNGPIAWLNFLDDDPGFFMASDGGLVFKNYQAARIFIEDTLAIKIPRIKLRWNNLRIDPLTARLASVGSDFHEDLTDSAGNTIPADGYFTALAVLTSHGWKLRNLHWSISKTK